MFSRSYLACWSFFKLLIVLRHACGKFMQSDWKWENGVGSFYYFTPRTNPWTLATTRQWWQQTAAVVTTDGIKGMGRRQMDSTWGRMVPRTGRQQRTTAMDDSGDPPRWRRRGEGGRDGNGWQRRRRRWRRRHLGLGGVSVYGSVWEAKMGAF